MASRNSKKAAVIGLGSIGRRHAANLAGLGIEPLGFDPASPSRHAARALGTTLVDTSEAAMATADCILICTPTSHHGIDLQRALHYGKPILVEKPIAHRKSALPDIADHRMKNVFVAFNLRYNPALQAARGWLAQGLLGYVNWVRLHAALYLPEWRPGTDFRKGYAADREGGGVLLDMAHEFDLALFLFGDAKLAGAQAIRSPGLNMPTEDCVDVLLRFASGPIGSVHVDYCSKPVDRYIEAAGDKGRLHIDLIGRTARLLDRDGSELRKFSAGTNASQDYIDELEDFLSLLHGKAPSEYLCTSGQAVKSLAIIESASHIAMSQSTTSQ